MPPLSSEDRRTLLALARQAVVDAVVRCRIPDSPPGTGRLAEAGGAFVTLYCGGRLQGCVGCIDGGNPLAETVVQCAISAALHDHRFPPLVAGQIDELRIQISVLSELFQISAQAIEIGTHGLLVTRGARRGLLLPQVATQHGWSVERFLNETCRKAGLESDAWRSPQSSLFAFTAEVFGETDSQSC